MSEFSWGAFLRATFLAVPAQVSAGRLQTEVSETESPVCMCVCVVCMHAYVCVLQGTGDLSVTQ